MKQNRNLRQLIISGMTREQLIDLIKRKDSFYNGVNFAVYSDRQLYLIADDVDEKAQEKKYKKESCN
jgi:hypothetical protein